MSDLNTKNLNLSLKNLKFHADMSEETPCFSADLYENGKLLGHVKNSGRGGCNSIYPADGLTYKDVEHVTDIDTDCYIMELAVQTDFVKKNQSKALVLKKGDDLYTEKFPQGRTITSMKKASNYHDWVATRKRVLDMEGFEVLNTNL